MWHVDLKRLEEQLYMYNPELQTKTHEFRNELFCRLEQQLQGYGPNVILHRLQQEVCTSKYESYSISEDQPEMSQVQCTNVSADISDEEPLSVLANRQKNRKKKERETYGQALASSMHHDAIIDEVEKGRESRPRKRSHSKAGSCQDSNWNKWLESTSKKECTTNYRVTTDAAVDDNQIAGMSLFVTPSSHNTPLTVTLHVPSVLREFDREIKFNIHMDSEELSPHLLSAKMRHIGTGEKTKTRRCISSATSQEKQLARVQPQKSVENVIPPTPQQEEATLSRLLSEVLVEPMDAIETWRATNAVSNINNNISDNYNTDISLTNFVAATVRPNPKPAAENSNGKKRRKSSKTNIETNVEPKKRHARKPKVKSDLAKYVEQFANNCEQPGSVTPASSISQQLVTSTTHNLDAIEPINFYYDGGQLIPITNLSHYTIDASQILQEDLNINAPFDDFVKYIDSSNTDVDSNVIARVLDGGNHTISLMNNRNGVFYATGKRPSYGMPIPAEYQSVVRLPDKSVLANVHRSHVKTPPPAHARKLPASPPIYIQTEDSACVLDLSSATKKCSSIAIVSSISAGADETDNCLPLNLSLRTDNEHNNAATNNKNTSSAQKSIVAVELDTDDQFIRQVMETSNFRAALDMPLLDVETGVHVTIAHDPTTQDNEATSSTATVADFEYLANNLPDDHMNAATAAATKHTADILSQFDQSSQAVFEKLLDVDSAVINDHEKYNHNHSAYHAHLHKNAVLFERNTKTLTSNHNEEDIEHLCDESGIKDNKFPSEKKSSIESEAMEYKVRKESVTMEISHKSQEETKKNKILNNKDFYKDIDLNESEKSQIKNISMEEKISIENISMEEKISIEYRSLEDKVATQSEAIENNVPNKDEAEEHDDVPYKDEAEKHDVPGKDEAGEDNLPNKSTKFLHCENGTMKDKLSIKSVVEENNILIENGTMEDKISIKSGIEEDKIVIENVLGECKAEGHKAPNKSKKIPESEAMMLKVSNTSEVMEHKMRNENGTLENNIRNKSVADNSGIRDECVKVPYVNKADEEQVSIKSIAEEERVASKIEIEPMKANLTNESETMQSKSLDACTEKDDLELNESGSCKMKATFASIHSKNDQRLHVLGLEPADSIVEGKNEETIFGKLPNGNSDDLLFIDIEIKESSDNDVLDISIESPSVTIDLVDDSSSSVNLKESISKWTALDKSDYMENDERMFEFTSSYENNESVASVCIQNNAATNKESGVFVETFDDHCEIRTNAATAVDEVLENVPVFEMKANLNDEWMDFDDDALSLAASSIGSPDAECSIEVLTEATDTGVGSNNNDTAEICSAVTPNEANKHKANEIKEPQSMLAAAASCSVPPCTIPVSSAGDEYVGNSLPVGSATIQAIFGVICWAYMVEECTAGAECTLSHQLREPHAVKIELESLTSWELNMSYRFVYNHTLLYRHYFPVYCKIYGNRKHRSKLLHMVNDCERYQQWPQYLLHIYYNLQQCGLNRVNACRVILTRCRAQYATFINVLVNMIIETDCTKFCADLERFAAGGKYKFDTEMLQKMAPTVLQTMDVRLAKIFFDCLLALNPEEIGLVYASPDLRKCLELITALGHASANAQYT